MSKRERKRPTIGVLASWHLYIGVTPSTYLEPIYSGILSAACERGCNVMLACGIGHDVVPPHPAWPVSTPHTDFVPVGPWNSDGLIVVTPLLSEERARYLQDLVSDGYPVVFIGKKDASLSVMPDNEGGIRAAVAHLVEHGHRRIVFVARTLATEGDGATTEGAYRLSTFRSAMEEHGLEPDPRLIIYGLHHVEGGRQAMQRLLDTGADFTAVLGSNDDSAVGAMTALTNKGLRIPQDVAVIGFDDRPRALTQKPPLTTVRYPTFEVGYRALELMLDHVAGKTTGKEVVKVPVRLIVRRSCGCPCDVLSPVTHLGKEVDSAGPNAMAAFVLAGTQHLARDEALALCERLLETFAGLEGDGPAAFGLALDETLERVGEAGDDPYAWQAAITWLQDHLPEFVRDHPEARQQAAAALDQARVVINESARRQYALYTAQQADVANRLDWLSVRLSAALNEEQIYETLAEYLPLLGIRRSHVALFEADGMDREAWSVVHPVDGKKPPTRVVSGQFSPADLYPGDNPFCLALLPLTVLKESEGFVVFETTDVGPCAAVVTQLAVALRNAQLYREATDARRVAEEDSRLRSRYLSTVSHDLRTPLNMVIGLSEILLSEQAEGTTPLGEQCRSDLAQIFTSARHLDNLIRDVLDLARSDVGRLQVTCASVDPGELLRSTAEIGERLAGDKGLEWQAEIPDDLPQLWADRTRLRQVALNLVANAIRFTGEGKVTLKATAREGLVEVSISDTGVGIPVEEQAILFDELRQSDRRTARGHGGLGLGLAVNKRLVELHGGDIRVQSSGGQDAGATFTFTIPVPEMPGVGEMSLPARGQTVLVLASQMASGENLRERLSQQGYDVEVEEYQESETESWMSRLLAAPPGAAVLDLELASEHGWEILKTLKGSPATRDVPVLFTSLEQGSGTVLEMDFLSKPMGTAELAQALERQGLADEGEQTTTVLVVDDDPAILAMHVRVVQKQMPTCRTVKARNGVEALEMIRRERPDLVLLDLMMPELDGFGVLETMRSTETMHDIPVIVLTSQVLTEEDMHRLNRGVAAVLGKGLFSAEETLAHMEKALARNWDLGSETKRLVRRAMAYIHEHYGESISRERIASHVGVSDDYLTRSFRKETGVTPVTYVNRYRVNQAKELLLAGERSVTEIALDVGFSSTSHFGSVFRREIGVSPSAYQRGERAPAGDEQSPPAGDE